MNPVSMNVNQPVERGCEKNKTASKGSIFEILSKINGSDKKDDVKDKSDILLLTLLPQKDKFELSKKGDSKSTEKLDVEDKSNPEKDKAQKISQEVSLLGYILPEETSKTIVQDSKDKEQNTQKPKKVQNAPVIKDEIITKNLEAINQKVIDNEKITDNQKVIDSQKIDKPKMTDNNQNSLQIKDKANSDNFENEKSKDLFDILSNSDAKPSSKVIANSPYLDKSDSSLKKSFPGIPINPSVKFLPDSKNDLEKIKDETRAGASKTHIRMGVSDEVQIKEDKIKNQVKTSQTLNTDPKIYQENVNFSSSNLSFSDRISNLNLENLFTEAKNAGQPIRIQTDLSDMSNMSNFNNTPDQKLFDNVSVKIQNLIKETFSIRNFKVEIDEKNAKYSPIIDAKVYESLPQSSRGEVPARSVPDESGDSVPFSRITDFIAKSLKDQKLPVKVEIQLNPPSLGRVEISLTEDGGRTMLIINSANDKTQEMLKSAMPVIVDRLSNLNFNIVNVQINGQEWYQNNSNEDNQRKDERNRKQNQEREKFSEFFKKEV
ncbi:flagellar hook-length control protein FliK [Athalassotoga sp.]|uniref:flagellar hook-length control protein FliK n=1 Tax=Athalassotoga sp. TaxID=2022597 RepID=UPI003D06F396